MWLVWLVDWIFSLNLQSWGIRPRHTNGLWGIAFSPFLHAGLSHLLSNTVPLIILLLLLAASRNDAWTLVAEIVVLSGAILWLFGRSWSGNLPLVHVGASGLIYGLISFLITVGLIEKRLISLAVAVLVGFLYGGSLLAGLLPTQPGVSWDGHLAGAVAGLVVASFNPASTRQHRSD